MFGQREDMVKQVASTNARLFSHWDRLTEVQQEKKIRPITIHLAPTNRCNLDCSFCSTKYREDQNTLQEINIDDAKQIVDMYRKLGAKSVEITGGGDPTMYPSINELIHYVSDHGLGVGMITNGLRLKKVEDEALKKLDWMRISLAGLEIDKDELYMKMDASRFPEMTGSSMVISQGQTLSSQVFDNGLVQLELLPTYLDNMRNQIERAMRIVDHLGLKYLRVVPNCYNLDEIKWARDNVPNLLKDYPKTTFNQAKDTTTPAKCYWKYMKPFVNADGYVYQCSTLSLFHGYFHPDWRIGHWTEIEKIYERPIESFDTTKCPYCFYGDQNNVLSDLVASKSIITPTFV